MTADHLVVELHELGDTCPFHDLPPAQTVWIREPGRTYPLSAEMACSEWHLAKALQPMWADARQVTAAEFDRIFSREAQRARLDEAGRIDRWG